MNIHGVIETLMKDKLGRAVAPLATGSLIVPAVIDNLDRVIALIDEELERRGCPFSVQNQIDIAVEELFVNVCNYAYPNQDKPGICRIDYAFSDNPPMIFVQFVDQGIPFDPLLRKDPTRPTSIQEAKIGGLGIYMTKKSVDDIAYRRDGDSNFTAFEKGW